MTGKPWGSTQRLALLAVVEGALILALLVGYGDLSVAVPVLLVVALAHVVLALWLGPLPGRAVESALLNRWPGPVMVVNRQGIMVAATVQARLLLGEQDLGRDGETPLSRYLAPADAIRIKSHLRHYQGGGENVMECALCPEALPEIARPVRLEIICHEPTSGQFVIRLALLRNTSAFDQRLQDNAQYFRSLFDGHPDAAYAFDRQGYLILTNARVTQLTGFSRRALYSQDFSHLIAEEDRERVWRHFNSALEGVPQHYECWLNRADSGQVLIDITNIPIVVDGEVTGVFGIARDITASHEGQRALALSESRFRALFESVGDGLFVLDHNDCVLSANRAASTILERPASELRGQPIEQFLDIARATSVRGKVSPLTLPSGQVRYIEVESGELTRYGSDGECYLFLRDVSQRYQAERDRRLLRASVAHIDDIVMITDAESLDEPGTLHCLYQ